ncbi:MAG: T9SS type A sorting domain-containing protein [Candidatus Kapabacteria bacterium]|nr:T9SS type A sorting domain-containing protein [Candidatus Kapabacteria bacterium]
MKLFQNRVLILFFVVNTNFCCFAASQNIYSGTDSALSSSKSKIQDIKYNMNQLIYSTYIGDNIVTSVAQGVIEGIAIDSSLNTYITCSSRNSKFPTTSGAYQINFAGGNKYYGDVAITKINPNGSALIFSTYLGGADADYSCNLRIDSANCVYVCGSTKSTDFPVTSNAFQKSILGNDFDCFITKINSTGSGLIYSTLIGGNKVDEITRISVDKSFDVFIAGSCSSHNYPTTVGAYQTIFKGEIGGFLTKMNPSGSALIFSSFISGDSNTYLNGLYLDNSNNSYLVGSTRSNNFPVTQNAFQKINKNTNLNGFFGKLNSEGSRLIYSSYISGSMDDCCKSVIEDSNSNCYITGYSSSQDFPFTTGSYRTNLAQGYTFITKFDSSNSNLMFSSMFGGSQGLNYPNNVTLDKNNNLNVVGNTTCLDYPTTLGAFQSKPALSSGFFTKLKSNGTALLYSTVLSGSGDDYANSVCLDSNDNVYISGVDWQDFLFKSECDFPVTQGAFQTHAINQPAFVLKLNTYVTPSIMTGAVPNQLCPGSIADVSCTIAGIYKPDNMLTVQLSDKLGSFANPINIGSVISADSCTIKALIPKNIPSGIRYRFRVCSSNPEAIGKDNGKNITILSLPVMTISAADEYCQKQIQAISCTGETDMNYSWSVKNGIIQGCDNCISANIQWSYEPSGTITLIKSAMNGCTDTSVKIIVLNPLPQPKINGKTIINSGDTSNFATPFVNSHKYKWLFSSGNIIGSDSNETVKITWSAPGTAKVKLIETSEKSCIDSATLYVTINEPNDVFEKPSNKEINIYPNPANDVLIIENNTEKAINSIRIYNIMGIIEQEYTQISPENTIKLNLSELSEGRYILQLRSGNETEVISFGVMR